MTLFDFIGSHIEVLDGEIRVSQSGYVASRLFEVDVDNKADDNDRASPEQVADKQVPDRSTNISCACYGGNSRRE